MVAGLAAGADDPEEELLPEPDDGELEHVSELEDLDAPDFSDPLLELPEFAGTVEELEDRESLR